MKKDGLEADHRIWTCFISAVTLCPGSSEALLLLEALCDSSFDLAIRFLTENLELLVEEVECCWMEKLEPGEDNTGVNFVNAREDLLWKFELWGTASFMCI